MPAPAAFRAQLLDAIPRLRRYSRSLVFDVHVADDLVQTTLERALAHWHQFDQGRDLLAWLMSIAHNAHLDDVRKQSRMTSLEVLPDDAAPLHGEGSGQADAGLRVDLLRALQRIPVEQREPLLLVSVEQFSYAECAQILRIPIGTVMSRISRARATLRAMLDGSAQPGATPKLKRVQ